jgi:hypothetical protein
LTEEANRNINTQLLKSGAFIATLTALVLFIMFWLAPLSTDELLCAPGWYCIEGLKVYFGYWATIFGLETGIGVIHNRVSTITFTGADAVPSQEDKVMGKSRPIRFLSLSEFLVKRRLPLAFSPDRSRDSRLPMTVRHPFCLRCKIENTPERYTHYGYNHIAMRDAESMFQSAASHGALDLPFEPRG